MVALQSASRLGNAIRRIVPRVSILIYDDSFYTIERNKSNVCVDFDHWWRDWHVFSVITFLFSGRAKLDESSLYLRIVDVRLVFIMAPECWISFSQKP